MLKLIKTGYLKQTINNVIMVTLITLSIVVTVFNSNKSLAYDKIINQTGYRVKDYADEHGEHYDCIDSGHPQCSQYDHYYNLSGSDEYPKENSWEEGNQSISVWQNSRNISVRSDSSGVVVGPFNVSTSNGNAQCSISVRDGYGNYIWYQIVDYYGNGQNFSWGNDFYIKVASNVHMISSIDIKGTISYKVSIKQKYGIKNIYSCEAVDESYKKGYKSEIQYHKHCVNHPDPIQRMETKEEKREETKIVDQSDRTASASVQYTNIPISGNLIIKKYDKDNHNQRIVWCMV